MMEDRRAWDEKVAQSRAVDKVAADLGLIRKGAHYFCPGCQPEGRGAPEMVIKKGDFTCFSCGATGDVVSLVKLARNCDLESAIAWLERETDSRT